MTLLDTTIRNVRSYLSPAENNLDIFAPERLFEKLENFIDANRSHMSVTALDIGDLYVIEGDVRVWEDGIEKTVKVFALSIPEPKYAGDFSVGVEKEGVIFRQSNDVNTITDERGNGVLIEEIVSKAILTPR